MQRLDTLVDEGSQLDSRSPPKESAAETSYRHPTCCTPRPIRERSPPARPYSLSRRHKLHTSQRRNEPRQVRPRHTQVEARSVQLRQDERIDLR
jgi:hypothetical protein